MTKRYIDKKTLLKTHHISETLFHISFKNTSVEHLVVLAQVIEHRYSTGRGLKSHRQHYKRTINPREQNMHI